METNKWKEEFRNHPRISVILQIIGCQKHGADFEGYKDLWNQLENDDLYVIEDYISQHFTPISELKRWVEENEKKILRVKGMFTPMEDAKAEAYNSALKALKDKFIKE